MVLVLGEGTRLGRETVGSEPILARLRRKGGNIRDSSFQVPDSETMILPPEAIPLLHALAPLFTRPTDSVVAAWSASLPAEKRTGGVEWPGKETVTSSDALAAVRRWLWNGWVFPQAGFREGLEKLPGPLRERLLGALAPAA
jgi:hypothetical protein